MSVQNEASAVSNGVDVQALLDARVAIEAAPESGLFTFRARCRWLEGTHSRSVMEGFYGLCEEQGRSKAHAVETDHPEQFAATDRAATPVEVLLSALAGCLTAGVASVAQHRGIQLNSVEAAVEGDMDMAGVLGIDGEVRNGFSAIRVAFEIDAEATQEEIAALVAQSQKRSAVFDIVTNPTLVQATARKA